MSQRKRPILIILGVTPLTLLCILFLIDKYQSDRDKKLEANQKAIEEASKQKESEKYLTDEPRAIESIGDLDLNLNSLTLAKLKRVRLF